MAESSHARSSQSEDFVVADFAAGSGELLFAAQSLWPMATVIATDIDPLAVRNLRAISRGWRTGVCDFLNPRSRRSSSVLRGLIGRTDLVLLNPPFSNRGGKRILATSDGVTTKCSLGLAFVVNAIDYLADDGELIAVLPEGSMTSEKDATTWNTLRGLGSVEVLKTNGFATFACAAVRTVVVRFQKAHHRVKTKPSPILQTSTVSYEALRPPVHIVRGTAAVNEVQRSQNKIDSVPFVHSTHLQDFTISSHIDVRDRPRRRAVGPMVLLPRVGQPKRNKVARCLDRKAFMLSDCVIALTCDSPETADFLWKDLQANWSMLEREYVGSGARYITTRRLSDLLIQLGYFPLIITSNGHCVAKRRQQNAGCQGKPNP